MKQLPAIPSCSQTVWMVEMWEYGFACIWGDAKIWGTLPGHGGGSATSLLRLPPPRALPSPPDFVFLEAGRSEFLLDPVGDSGKAGQPPPSGASSGRYFRSARSRAKETCLLGLGALTRQAERGTEVTVPNPAWLLGQVRWEC